MPIYIERVSHIDVDVLDRDLDEGMAIVAGHLNVQHARAVALIAEAIGRDEWRSRGIHSPEHWVRLTLGVAEAQARQLVKVARRWSDFPETMTEFAAGGLSLGQVEVIVARAPEWADQRMAGFAPGLSVSQLRNMVRDEFFEHEPAEPAQVSQDGAVDSTITPSDSTDATDDSRPGASEPRLVPGERPDHFGYEWRDGRLVVFGEFAADRGTAIEAIVEHVRDELWRATGTPVSGAETFGEIVARAGAGGFVSDAWGNGSRLGDVLGRTRTFLHLEVGDEGRRLVGHLSNGVRMPQAIGDYLTCDGSITPVWLRDSVPFGYGREQRVVPVKLRRHIEHRDRGCRVPGCGNRIVEVHHVEHWSGGGVTETWNLLSLCPKHHRMHHLGLLGITGNPDLPDGVEFRDSFGEPIAAPRPIKPAGEPPPPTRPFEPGTLERMGLRQFYGWTERAAITARRFAEHRAAHPPGDARSVGAVRSGDPRCN